MKQGIVKALHKDGYGYISFEDEDKNIFFHCSKVKGAIRYDNLEKGMKVTVEEIVEVDFKGVTKRECIGVQAVK